MGYLYKCKNSPYWWAQYSHKGRRIRESTKQTLKTAARNFLLQREAEIAQGKCPSVNFEGVRFDELLADYISDSRMNGKRSVGRSEQVVHCHLTRHFDGLRAADITTARIRDYIQARQREGAAPASINRELAVVKRAFRLAVRETPPKVQSIPYVPMIEGIQNARHGFLENEEFKIFHNALPEYLKPLASFAYITGCRAGEILGLTWDRVDRQTGRVELGEKDTKTGKARLIILDDELRAIIGAEYAKQGRERLAGRSRDGAPCPYVFQRRGKPIGDFRKAWNKAMQAIGRTGYGGDRETNITIHDFRRSAIRNMTRAGVSDTVAMKISGHRTRSVFDRYNITSEADLVDAAQRVEAMRNRTGKP
jgi:integrase